MLRRLAEKRNITGGLALDRYFPDRPNDLLVCVTEINSREDIDQLVNGLASLNQKTIQPEIKSEEENRLSYA